jgi:two-component system chemotaxis sensor kinase CheA
MDLSRYAELFLTESQEHLQAVNEALLELERGGFDAAVVDRFFRAVHTIKGMSATMGYDAVAQLSHEMESLLSEVRDGSRGLDGDLLDPLFRATDALEQAVNDSAAGHADHVNVTDAIAAISSLRSSGGIPATGDRRKARRTQETTVVAPGASGPAFVVQLRKDTALPGVRAFLIIERLRQFGKILHIDPAKERIQDEGFDGLFAITIQTAKPHTEILEVIRAVGDVQSAAMASEAAVRDNSAPTAAPASDEGAVAHGTKVVPDSRPRPERRGVKHVRVEQRRLDALMNLVGELVIAKGRLMQRASVLADTELEDALSVASRQISELQNEIMASRMVPVWQVFDRFPRLVRDAARSLNKKVDFVMEGREIELDRSLLEEIGDPLVHLLRNAVDHGIEGEADRVAAGKSATGRLVLSASRDREAVLVTVSDDGRGVDRDRVAHKAREMNLLAGDPAELTDEQLLSVMSTSGLSTAAQVTDISGRGVGVDAVITKVRSLGGNVELRTALGEGTSVTIRLPLTLAIIPAMLARAADEIYAFPLTHVAETVEVDAAAFRTVRGVPVTVLRGEVLPLLWLREVVQLPAAAGDSGQLVVLEVASKRAGLIVDELVGQQEVVVKQFDAVRGGLSVFSGATILGNGELALIVDVGSII